MAYRMQSAREMYLTPQVSHQVQLTCEQAINSLPEPLRSGLMSIWTSKAGTEGYDRLMTLASELDRLAYPNAHFVANCFRGVAHRMAKHPGQVAPIHAGGGSQFAPPAGIMVARPVSHQAVRVDPCETAIYNLPESLKSLALGAYKSKGIPYETLMAVAAKIEHCADEPAGGGGSEWMSLARMTNCKYVADCFRAIAAKMSTFQYGFA